MNKIEEIKEYISLLENSSLSVLEIEKEDGTKIHLEKEHPAQQIFNTSPIGAYQPTATDVPAPAPVQPQASAAPVKFFLAFDSVCSRTESDVIVNAHRERRILCRIGTGQGSFCSCRKESKQGLNRLHYRGYEVYERNSG